MFDIGATELLVIAIVAIIFVGPRDLPRMLRTVGQWVGRAKAMAQEFRTQFDAVADESGLDEFKKGLEDVRSIAPVDEFRDAVNPISDAGADVTKAVNAPATPAKKSPAKKSPAEKSPSKKPAVKKSPAKTAAGPKQKNPPARKSKPAQKAKGNAP